MTNFENEIIRRMYASGKFSYKQLADHFDTSVYYIKKAIHAKRGNYKRYNGPLPPEPMMEFLIQNTAIRIGAI